MGATVGVGMGTLVRIRWHTRVDPEPIAKNPELHWHVNDPTTEKELAGQATHWKMTSPSHTYGKVTGEPKERGASAGLQK